VIEGQSQYLCEWKDCEYHTKHLNAVHFQCVQLNCDKIFKTYISLNEYLKDHLCGYGIKGLEKNGIYDDENLKTFYDKVYHKNKCLFSCKKCEFVTKFQIKRHLHPKHVCIFRQN
jgi:hypothetical protein